MKTDLSAAEKPQLGHHIKREMNYLTGEGQGYDDECAVSVEQFLLAVSCNQRGSDVLHLSTNTFDKEMSERNFTRRNKEKERRKEGRGKEGQKGGREGGGDEDKHLETERF